MEDAKTRGGLPEPAHSALTAVLDGLIPTREDGTLPGAGALGLASYVEEQLGDAAQALIPSLEALDALASRNGVTTFAQLDPAARHEILTAYDKTDPGFLPGLIFHTYAGYYQSPEVLEALGLEGRPPHPLGFEIGPDDPHLLDVVRTRSKLYREP